MDSEQSNAINTDQQERPSNSNCLHVHEGALPPVRFSNEAHNKPVQLISIKPLVEDDHSERRRDNTDSNEESSRRTGFSKYNWKNFLPIARR